MSPHLQLTLASRSPYRRQLIERLGLVPSIRPADIDERPLEGEAPDTYVQRLSREKATTVAGQLRQPSLVIGSDQAAVLDGQILGKPGNRQRAIEMLSAASGREVRFLTGLCVMPAGDSAPARDAGQTMDITRVFFRSLNARDIAAYVDREPAFDCAGVFRCEGLGITLFDHIESRDPTALIGLPLIALSRMLRDFGMDPLSPG